MLDKLRDRCEVLITSNISDEEMCNKFKLIKNILNNDKCFFEIDIDTAISILVDLEFDIDTAKKMYISLVNDENF